MSFSSSSSSLSIFFLNPTVRRKPRTALFSTKFPFSSRNLVCLAAQFDRDESLWLREEQRWLREEQRWLREEQRWARERDALLRRVAELELLIQAADRRSSVEASAEVSDAIAGLIEVLKEKSLIAEAGSSASPMVLEEKERDEVVAERVVRVVAEEASKESEPKKKQKKSSLRKGSEGQEVRALQEALQKLGFYSGEEDIEYSSFSSGTERAVKTWQASLGAREDGIMTEELLEILFMGHVDSAGSIASLEDKEDANGAAVSSVTKISNIKQTVVKEDDKGVAGVEVTQHRVFLLGENRWEEPSRLSGTNKKAGESTSNAKQSTVKCIACRGEGRLMCTECDGTGEPNIEPQFLEWVDEGATCPYCDGLGYTICDVCDGKKTV